MSTPTVKQLLESGLENPPTAPLDFLIRQSIEHAVRNADSEMDQLGTTAPSSCVNSGSSNGPSLRFEDMGKFLIRTAEIWAQVTESLTTGPHIQMAIQDMVNQTVQRTDLSYLTGIDSMTEDEGRLRKSRDLAAQHYRDMMAIWAKDTTVPELSPTSNSPYAETKTLGVSHSFSSGSDPTEQRGAKPRKVLPDKSASFTASSPGGNASASEDSDDGDDEQQFRNIDMSALMQRGKGSYTCPLGRSCTKGGVDLPSNTLLVFDRNSAFKQHCNKHLKPYRCEMPGCPNQPHKRRFARRDGLERHKTSVKHDAVPDFHTT